MKNNNFVKNVIIIVSGTAGAQIITMIFSPFITRIYGPEAFGVMGTFTAMLNILIPIAALTYPIAIVLPKEEKEAKEIIKLSLLTSLLLSTFLFFIIITFKDTLALLFNLKDYSNYLYLVPIVILSAGFMQSIEQWLIRTEKFAISAKVTFYQSLIINLGKVGVGILYPVAQILIIFAASTYALRGLMMMVFSKSFGLFTDIKNNFRGLCKIAQKHIDFPLYRAPQDLLHAIQISFPIIMLTSFFGPSAAGFYTLGRTVLRLPSVLLGKAVGDVFYPRIAEASNNKEDLSKIIQKATLSLAAIGILPYLVVILFGPILFSFVFGVEWKTAGEYAQWIAMLSYFTFINRPSVVSLPVLGVQKFHLIYTLIWTIINFTLIFVGYYIFKSDVISIALFCLSGVISNLLLINISINLSKKHN